MLEKYQDENSELGSKAVEIYRRMQRARQEGNKIYDDPEGCFFDGAGGIIVPSGNMNAFIRDEYLQMLNNEGKTERYYEFGVKSADW